MGGVTAPNLVLYQYDGSNSPRIYTISIVIWDRSDVDWEFGQGELCLLGPGAKWRGILPVCGKTSTVGLHSCLEGNQNLSGEILAIVFEA